MQIRQATIADAAQIAALYNWYIGNTAITFETEPVSDKAMVERIGEKLNGYDWLVCAQGGEISGYAYYGSFRPRAAYGHTVESTIYLAQSATGCGFGKALYGQLLNSAKQRGYREIIGVIALPNPASLALHTALGFGEVGILKQVGYKFNQYIDVAMYQRTLSD